MKAGGYLAQASSLEYPYILFEGENHVRRRGAHEPGPRHGNLGEVPLRELREELHLHEQKAPMSCVPIRRGEAEVKLFEAPANFRGVRPVSRGNRSRTSTVRGRPPRSVSTPFPPRAPGAVNRSSPDEYSQDKYISGRKSDFRDSPDIPHMEAAYFYLLFQHFPFPLLMIFSIFL